MNSEEVSGESIPPQPDEAWWDSLLRDEHQSEERWKNKEIRHERDVGLPEDWLWAGELYEFDETVDLAITGYNRGGLLVEAKSLRGFVPLSHLISIEANEGEHATIERFSELVGDTLCLKVIEIDPDRGRLVFSERAAQAGPGERVKLLASIQPGDQVRGAVTNITRFGVFVELGGLEGLIHVSELSWGRVRHPNDVLSCGNEVEVKVLSIDRKQGRIALSLKELMPDPWQQVEAKYRVGDIVQGQVTNVVRFGAFVAIEEGLEGLIHISELGEGKLLHPRSVLNEGEAVRARVINIDAARRRMGLSLRTELEDVHERLEEEPEVLSSY
jgi:small subunit ribosomal protein S1